MTPAYDGNTVKATLPFEHLVQPVFENTDLLVHHGEIIFRCVYTVHVLTLFQNSLLQCINLLCELLGITSLNIRFCGVFINCGETPSRFT
jgi:hypothetical protein